MSLTLVLSVVRWKRPELVRSNIAHRLLAANSLPKTTIFPLRSWLGLGTELKMREPRTLPELRREVAVNDHLPQLLGQVLKVVPRFHARLEYTCVATMVRVRVT